MSRSSFLSAGYKDSDNDTRWEPKIDKDPFHRTMDIFNGVFKKNVKLSAGKINCTDLHTIYINFGEYKPSKIEQILRPGDDALHLVFLLACGHEWTGKKINKEGLPRKVGDWGMCATCGTDSVYRGFEHEWQHIIFKTDLAAQSIFCDQHAEQLLKQLPSGGISKSELKGFIHMLVNAFDDIRVNSLWEKVYPGSALAIWERWQQFAARMESSKAFLPFIFAVAFRIPTNPQGEFEPMRPVIEWALKRIKYRGFNNMLLDVRVVIDRCMGALLANLKPKLPPKLLHPPQPPPTSMPVPPPSSPGGSGQSQGEDSQGDSYDQQGSQQDQDDEDGQNKDQKDESQGSQSQNSSQDSEDSEDSSDPNHQGQPLASGNQGESNQEVGEGNDDGDEESQNTPGSSRSGDESLAPLAAIPSAASVSSVSETEIENALSKLMMGQKSLDPKEEHSEPDETDLETAKKSQSLRAALNHILHTGISDSDLQDDEPDGEPDADMQAQITQLQDGIAHKSESSQLTDGAKARVTIIKVTKEGTGRLWVKLEDEERSAIQRLRATFLRSMGRQKAKRASTGVAVDVEAVIQYLNDNQDPDVFENRDVSRGFAYSVVSDMSGSMTSCFPDVCRAVEILKQALDFPFVTGNLWGFRGGQPIGSSRSNKFGGEVWMYQFDKDVDWYAGTAQHRIFPGPNGLFEVPVECGGITPMNSAINIATSHLWRKTPAGMAKRMFLLTDGSPMQTKVTGRMIPEFLLRQFVANEIARAWKHGIQVNTVVIGENAIDDAKCLQMFGPSKQWIKVKQSDVGSALVTLVLRNFNRYLRRS